MRLFSFLLFVCLLPHGASAQSDTTWNYLKKLSRKRVPLPYYAAYTDKEFIMDSIRNTAEGYGYIRYRAQIMPRPANTLIPYFINKKYLQLDTLKVLENGDTCYADVFALGTMINSPLVTGLLIERQFAGYYYRSSEKFLFTFDKKGKRIDQLRLATETPPEGPSNDNYDRLEDRFSRLPWFTETEGLVNRNLSILLGNETGKLSKYQVRGNGKVQKRL